MLILGLFFSDLPPCFCIKTNLLFVFLNFPTNAHSACFSVKLPILGKLPAIAPVAPP